VEMKSGCHPQLWHQTPIELSLTCAVGPEQVFSMKPEPGAELKYPGGFLRLLVVTNKMISGWGGRSNGGTNVLTLQIDNDTSENTPRTSMVVLNWPRANDAPLDFEFFDQKGEKLEMSGRGSSDHLHILGGEIDRERIHEIRVKFYPRICRVVFTIPELPGLPEKNRNLTNLFDAHIPYIRFQYEYEFRSDLEKLVAMDLPPTFALKYPPSLFPMVRTNTTPRELFAEFLSYRANPDDHLLVDSERNVIRIQKSPLAMIIDRLKKLLPGK
jgi:hypothetical protein